MSQTMDIWGVGAWPDEDVQFYCQRCHGEWSGTREGDTGASYAHDEDNAPQTYTCHDCGEKVDLCWSCHTALRTLIEPMIGPRMVPWYHDHREALCERHEYARMPEE